MISALYVEEAVREHPRTLRLQSRFADVPHIVCQSYGEVFNRRGQDFRTQKKHPALILAEKRGRHVLPTPPGYGIGGRANYYFSHILNCLYDCRYCFLQGLYQSANYVFFINFEDFQSHIDLRLADHAREDAVYFFSGYDGDSFALESLTGFIGEHLEFFRHRPRALLELRTKSLRAKDLLKHAPLSNVVVAFSLTPAIISRTYEIGVPPLAKRLQVMGRLARQGWPIGLRFDPIIGHEGCEKHYDELFDQVFEELDPRQIHSVSLGLMRFPRAMHRQMARLYPEEPLLAANLTEADGQITCDAQDHIVDRLSERLQQRHVPKERIFACS